VTNIPRARRYPARPFEDRITVEQAMRWLPPASVTAQRTAQRGRELRAAVKQAKADIRAIDDPLMRAFNGTLLFGRSWVDEVYG
jgi:hypothetical protein